MRLLVFVLLLPLVGCASSQLIGSADAPPGYAPLELGSAPALDSVNVALADGRFTIEMLDGGQSADVRSVAVGPETTRFQLDSGAERYVLTVQVHSIVGERGQGGAEVGALVGALPGTALMVLALTEAASSECDSSTDSYCELGRLVVVIAAGIGLLGAGMGGLLGGAVGALVSPARDGTEYYVGPITRYLPEPTPAVTSDL